MLVTLREQIIKPACKHLCRNLHHQNKLRNIF